MTTTFRLRQPPEPLSDSISPGDVERLRAAVMHAVAAGAGRRVLASVGQHQSTWLVCVALGVPRGDWQSFSRWAARPADPRSVDALGSYVDVMVADRCRKPADDLVSDLISFAADDSGLTADELRELVVALVMG